MTRRVESARSLSTHTPMPAAVLIDEHSAGSKAGRPAPVESLAALEKKAFTRADAWGVDDLRAEAKKTASLLLVARADPATAAASPSSSSPPPPPPPDVLGYLAATTTGTSIHILRVATHPDARRRGVASARVSAARAPDPGGTRRRRPLGATLHVDPANAPARALYERAGFAVDAQLEDYYAPGRAALRMILCD